MEHDPYQQLGEFEEDAMVSLDWYMKPVLSSTGL